MLCAVAKRLSENGAAYIQLGRSSRICALIFEEGDLPFDILNCSQKKLAPHTRNKKAPQFRGASFASNTP
jgi:hypothetical protein